MHADGERKGGGMVSHGVSFARSRLKSQLYMASLNESSTLLGFQPYPTRVSNDSCLLAHAEY